MLSVNFVKVLKLFHCSTVSLGSNTDGGKKFLASRPVQTSTKPPVQWILSPLPRDKEPRACVAHPPPAGAKVECG